MSTETDVHRQQLAAEAMIHRDDMRAAAEALRPQAQALSRFARGLHTLAPLLPYFMLAVTVGALTRRLRRGQLGALGLVASAVDVWRVVTLIHKRTRPF